MNYTKDDIERIIKNVLDELTLEIETGCFTDPNFRKIILKLHDKEITSTYIDITNKPEYSDY